MSDPKHRSLEEIRTAIDGIDAQLISLLNKRAELAIEVGHLKDRENRPFFSPERERQIYEKLEASNPGPLLPRQLVSIFREIISAARAAEKPLHIAYWGPAGSFTHLAASKTFGQSSIFEERFDIPEVFQAVERGQCDYGVVPVENSLGGFVPETIDQFPITNVRICAEAHIPVHHHLLTAETDLKAIKRIYAGPQPVKQCSRWLHLNLPGIEIQEVVPTSKAAERAKGEPGTAAIGNRYTSELQGLNILAEHIEDNRQNRTRFLVIGYNEPVRTGKDKTTMMFNLRNRPGELSRALAIFAERNIDLMRIETRPTQRAPFEQIFYLDCRCHKTQPEFTEALEALSDSVLEVNVLGSYPIDPVDSI